MTFDRIARLQSSSPRTDATTTQASEPDVDQAVSLAAQAFWPYRAISAAARAGFLDRIAEEILALGDAFIAQAHRETSLPEARLVAERARTVNQLRMFVELVREGSWVDARIDRALPGRAPLPRPDMRRMLTPLGPVAVFAASNLPIAFSVAGGDTASALATGCTVVCKAHPGHPGASEMAASAIQAAAAAAGMPPGTFALIHGGPETGAGLVRHPHLKAVAFTGSLRAGRALFDIAAGRPEPIPFYGEMGSVNPVLVLPGALEERGAEIAAGLAQSVTANVGQFCTNPGLVIGLREPALDRFISTTAELIGGIELCPMLNGTIRSSYEEGLFKLQAIDHVRLHTRLPSEPGDAPSAAVLSTTALTLMRHPRLAEELFGPSTLIVTCESVAEIADVAQSLAGQLTVSVHGTPIDMRRFRDTIAVLSDKAGRVVFNGFPTGVEVCHAMQHGGPYPATTDSRSTSVGSAAIFRFARPICWQGAPQDLLPPELQDVNPLGISRLVDGEWTRDPLWPVG